MMSESYLRNVRDSLHKEIEARNEAFQSLRLSYFDTTGAGRARLFEALKSDSLDLENLSKYKNSPYFDLLYDVYQKYREAIHRSRFYHSQPAFENYLQTRSFSVMDSLTLSNVFNGEEVSRARINDYAVDLLRDRKIDFVILFTVSYTSDYSDQAGARIAEENLHIACFSVTEKKIISEVSLIYFLP